MGAEQTCWHCRRPVTNEWFCPGCSKLQPLPPRADHFDLFGLTSKRMAVETGRLEEAFYALSRRVHPDRFQARSPEERRIAEQRSAALNVAYRTLRDPVARAQYILSLEGRGSGGNDLKPPAELLMEVMELQETAEAYRDADGSERESLERTLEEIVRELEGRSAAIMEELSEAFGAWDQSVVDEGAEEAKAPLLERFQELLDKRRYYLTTARDIKAALAGEPPPGRHED